MTATKIELTDALIRAASCPQGTSQAYLRDTKQRGLAVRLRSSSGAKSFVFEHTRAGCKGTFRTTIAPVDKISLAAARKQAAILAGEHAKGTDLVQAKRAAKQAARVAANAATLGMLVQEGGPYEQWLRARQLVNWKTTGAALRRLLPQHQHTDLRRLTRRDIVAAMDQLTPGAARDLRKHCSAFLNWAVTQGYVDYSVLAGMRAAKQTRAERLDRNSKGRALGDDEIRAIWTAAGELGSTFGLLVKIALLGGMRRGEAAKITWGHVVADRILVEPHATKMGKGHAVPRTDLVNGVLEAARHFQRAGSDLVFPSWRGSKPISGFAKLLGKLISQSGVAKFTMHDLRRTLRTIMSKCGFDNEVQRLCVGQKPRGIDAVYNLDEQWQIRCMAFQSAHNYIAALIEGERTDNLVRLARANNPQNKLKAELLDRLREHHTQVIDG